MEKNKPTEKEITLEMVKSSEFGCCNCLWLGVECIEGTKFQPRISITGQPSCKAYTYCD